MADSHFDTEAVVSNCKNVDLTQRPTASFPTPPAPPGVKMTKTSAQRVGTASEKVKRAWSTAIKNKFLSLVDGSAYRIAQHRISQLGQPDHAKMSMTVESKPLGCVRQAANCIAQLGIGVVKLFVENKTDGGG